MLSDNQKEESLGGRREAETEKERTGGAGKKQMSEGNEEGEMENKRGRWRQIKDTQLND